MGYEVHITRAAHWTESEKKPITLAEWEACVQSDPEMRMDNFAEITSPAGMKIRIDGEGIAVWKGHSAYEEGVSMPWISLRMGRIIVKNPEVMLTRPADCDAADTHG